MFRMGASSLLLSFKNSKMTSLKEGDKAPNFTVLNQDDKLLTLDTYKGKKLILYFYPKDSTPGCTAESCNLRDNYSELLALGFEVLGVSADSSSSHQKFISNNQLPFHLLSDTEKEVRDVVSKIKLIQPKAWSKFHSSS